MHSNPILSVLTKTLVREFYRLNTGFFFTVLGIAFGFLRTSDHIVLAEFFVSSPAMLLIPSGVWILYIGKVILFNRQAIYKTENSFLYNTVMLPSHLAWITLIITISAQLAPVSLYAVFLMSIAFKQKMNASVALILLAVVLLHIAVLLLLHRLLLHPDAETRPSSLKQWLDRHVQRPYGFIVLEWVARNELSTLAGTKLFSYPLLLGVLSLYNNETYDLRLMNMGVTFAFTAHAFLLYHYHRFENFYFSLTRNLPIAFYKRAGSFLFTMVVFCLPETGLLLSRFPNGFTIPDILATLAYGLSLVLLFYGLLYLKDLALEKLGQFILFLTLFFIVIILFSIPSMVLCLANTITGVLLWRYRYYSFEYTQDNNKES